MLRITEDSTACTDKGFAIAVIGPDNDRRTAIAGALIASAHVAGDREAARFEQRPSPSVAIQEFVSYPPDLVQVPAMLAKQFDVVLIDLDSDTEFALDLVAAINLAHSATVMVYSAQPERNLVIRCMRAGAREFLVLPLAPGDIDSALARIRILAPAPRSTTDKGKKVFVFLGAKGGCGVTSIASGFATALAQESKKSTLLIDLGLPIGDAAIHLGLSCDYSVENALEEWNRLDANFLQSLLVEHDSGLSVLAAPPDFPRTRASIEAIERLVAVAQQNFHFVVVDLGSRIDLKDSSLFDESVYLYLVTQVGITELRNANRLITQYFYMRSQRFQVVLNRYVSQTLGFSDDIIAKALTRPAQWKIPDDDADRKRVRQPGNGFADEESAALIAIRQMARSACGLPALEERKKKFKLFKFG
jgi:pilus assembly protein CpaE